MRINKNLLSPLVENDPVLMSNLRQGFYPNAEAGMYFYNSNYFFGVSASRIINSTYLIGESNLDLYIIPTHFFVIAGLQKNINNDIVIEPFVVAKANTDRDKQIDLNLKTIIRDNYRAGLSYRMNIDNMPIKSQSVSFMAGLKFLDQFRFTYIYEYSLSGIRTLQWGTHELTLTYEIPRKYKNKRKTRGKRGSAPCPAYGRPHSYR
jgi:type IX secretion system PorP/SprF family membrane protein